MQAKESKTNTHFIISLLKSAVRMIACYFLIKSNLVLSGLLFAGAETLGIMEEL